MKLLSAYTIARNCTDITDVTYGIDEIQEKISQRNRADKPIPRYFYNRLSKLQNKLNTFNRLTNNAPQLTMQEKQLLKRVAHNVLENVVWCEENEVWKEDYENFFEELDNEEYEALKLAIMKLKQQTKQIKYEEVSKKKRCISL